MSGALTLRRQKRDDIDSLGLKFVAHEVSLDTLEIVKGPKYDEKKSGGSTHNIKNIFFKLGGAEKAPTGRFWNSLAVRAGISANIFKHFDYEEVLERLTNNKALGDSNVRIIEDVNSGTLLSISPVDKPYVPFQNAVDLLKNSGGNDISYSNAKIRSFHDMPSGAPMLIQGEEFSPQIMVEIPIDGYGSINSYVSLIRQVCSNGMVAYAPKFKTKIPLGKSAEDALDCLQRMFDSYSNDEAVDALGQRWESATKSTLSVGEAMSLYDVMSPALSFKTKNETSKNACSAIKKKFKDMIGDLNETYGVANLDALTSKQAASLPCECRVSDAFNFATELCTHVLNRHSRHVDHAMKIQAAIGSMISKDYDLEGLVPKSQKGQTIEHPSFYFSVA